MKLTDLLFEDLFPGDAPPDEQVHVFDFDDTLGVTSNANGVMLYKDGKPAHKSEAEVKEWLKSLGVPESAILEPGIKPIKERDGGMAAYLSSSGLAKVQKSFPSDKQGVTTGHADKVNQPGETILIDFTPSSGTDVSTTKPIKKTIDKLKKANSQGSETIVITARKADGEGTDFHGNPVKATNSKDMEDFLSQYQAKPTDGVMGVTGQNKGLAIINKYIADSDAPEEIHFYDDLKKNTDEVEAAVAEKVPSELHIYGPGEFAHDEADPDSPNKSYDKKNEGVQMNQILERWHKLAGLEPLDEAAKPKGLWHNIRQRRKKGMPRKKPGQKGYPKTLDIGESAVRAIVRDQLLREYGIIDAMLNSPWSVIPGLIGIFKEIFGPNQAERLIDAGDDKVIDDYQTFLNTLHMTPEYKTIWENYKLAQRRHASMDTDYDFARDPNNPVGRAFIKLRTRVMSKFDEMERTFSPENRDIWEESVTHSRQTFKKIFDNWSRGKITTGRVLAILDPRGVVESRVRGKSLTEAGEMFAGRDLEQMQTSELLAALEMAEMDLEDAGCPEDSVALGALFELMDMIDSARERPNYTTAMIIPLTREAISIIRDCEHIDEQDANRIAEDLESALESAQEQDGY